MPKTQEETDAFRLKKVREKTEILAIHLANYLSRRMKSNNFDSKDLDAYTKLIDRINGATPGKLPPTKTKVDNDVIISDHSSINNSPDLPPPTTE